MYGISFGLPVINLPCRLQAGSYFNRDNVSLPGFRDFFKAASLEERGHAQQLMDYQVGITRHRSSLFHTWQSEDDTI